MSSASQPLDDGSLQPPPVDIDTLYFEIAGGEKMRRVYVLAHRLHLFILPPIRVPGAHTYQHLQLELERLCNRSSQIRKQRWIEQLLS